MNILGISCFYHEAAASLVQDGVLIAASAEERFTRQKHDSAFPTQAVNFCLEEGGIKARDLDYVVFYEKPFIKFERILFTSLANFPRSWRFFPEAMINTLGEKLWVKNIIADELKIEASKILFVPHHLSHAASAYYCSPFTEAAILTLDGVGEWTTGTQSLGTGEKIKVLREHRFPHSLGLLYSVFTAFLGFEVNDGEYKVMGMAPYGVPRYVDKIHKIAKVFSDGSLWLDLDYFAFHYSPKDSYNQRFVTLFGEPRDPKLHFFTKTSGYPSYFGEKPSDYAQLVKKNQDYADIAASIQKFAEEVILKMAQSLFERTKVPNLCLAGGVGLNSVANGRLLRESKFQKIFIQPAAGDDGGAIGAAFFAYHQLLGKKRNFVMTHSYWGKEYTEKEISQFLKGAKIKHQPFSNEEKLLERVVDKLTQGKVIGWYQGRFEWGPRALGNRSILADPRREEMKDIVNTKIKFREPYRPFAPAVLEEEAQNYFDIGDLEETHPARFMLTVAKVKKPKRDKIPAVTHVDGTGRLQAVSRATNQRYYDLIRLFGQKTGVPVLLNTSFNLKGEPIVTRPQEAYNTFRKGEIDTLVLGSHLIEKES